MEQLAHDVEVLLEKNKTLTRSLLSSDSDLLQERICERRLLRQNEELVSELMSVKAMCRDLQEEKDRILSRLHKDMEDVTLERDHMKHTLYSVEAEIKTLQKEKVQASQSFQKVSQETQETRSELDTAIEVINVLQEEKNLLIGRVESLVANERALILEIERLNRRHNASGGSFALKTSMEVEHYLKGLEEDKNYWKREAQMLQQLNCALRQRLALLQQSSVADTDSGSLKKVNKRAPLKQRKSNGGVNGTLARSTTKSRASSTDSASHKRPNSRASKEVSRNEANLLDISSTCIKRENSFNRFIPDQHSDPIVTYLKLERDDLRAAFHELEEEAIEMQAEIRLLTNERNELQARYQQSRLEKGILEEECVSAEKSFQQATSTGNKRLREIEGKNEEMKGKLLSSNKEIQNLRKDLQESIDSAAREKIRMQTSICEMMNSLKLAHLEHETLEDRIAAMRQQITCMETENESLNRQLKALENDSKEEIEKLQQELRESTEEKEALQHRIQEYLQEIQRVENLLAEGEKRQAELVDEQRVLKTQLEGEVNEKKALQLELTQTKRQLKDVEQELENIQRELKSTELKVWEHRQDLNHAEQQTFNRSMMIEEITLKLKQSLLERDELLRNLHELRGVCSRLEQRNAELSKELYSRNADEDQMIAQIDELTLQLNSLRDQQDMEKAKRQELETVAEQNLQRERKLQAELQERTGDVHRLREELASSNERLQDNKYDIEKLIVRKKDLENEVEFLNRQLDDERRRNERLNSDIELHNRVFAASRCTKSNGLMSHSATTFGRASPNRILPAYKS